MELPTVKSASNLHYLIRNRPSTPIEIPTRRRAVMSPIHSSPTGRPTSPEMIFEMSPVASEFPSSAQFLGFSASQMYNDQDPFMYHFPVFTARDFNSKHTSRHTSHVMTEASIPTMAKNSSALGQVQRCPAALAKVNGIDPSDTHSSSIIRHATPVMTTKITGFVPINPVQTPISSTVCDSRRQSISPKSLSPPPRRSSFSPSSWLHAGKADIQDDDLASIESDPIPFDFERYLMQRMENQKSSRFRGLQFLPSIHA